MQDRDSEYRRHRARKAAHTMHAQHNSQATTAAARAAGVTNLAYWRKKVNPDGTLDPVECERRARHARKAFYADMAMRSAQARRARS